MYHIKNIFFFLSFFLSLSISVIIIFANIDYNHMIQIFIEYVKSKNIRNNIYNIIYLRVLAQNSKLHIYTYYIYHVYFNN